MTFLLVEGRQRRQFGAQAGIAPSRVGCTQGSPAGIDERAEICRSGVWHHRRWHRRRRGDRVGCDRLGDGSEEPQRHDGRR